MRNIQKTTPAKRRENERQARYFKDEIIQPFDDRGRRSTKFERMYGTKIYGKRA